MAFSEKWRGEREVYGVNVLLLDGKEAKLAVNHPSLDSGMIVREKIFRRKIFQEGYKEFVVRTLQYQ